MRVVCTSGYFNPLHKGHLALFREAKKLGDKLVVIVNNDEQVILKGSKLFMVQDERMEIVRALKDVDEVVLSIDSDKSVRKTLRKINPHVFAKGGDSTLENIPELEVIQDLQITLYLDVGGGKIQSSSWLKSSV